MTKKVPSPFVAWFEDVSLADIARVGGKNASLGEMIRELAKDGIRVPPGFAMTSAAYWCFIDDNALRPAIAQALAALASKQLTLADAGHSIRERLRAGKIPDAVRAALVDAYAELCRREGVSRVSVAVRSSATAEDLPEASFAGQQETFLNVRGDVDLVEAFRDCVASLFTDRAIVYRDEHKFDHMKVALSVGVQKMVRSDLASAGVIFTLDTETGFPNVVTITSSWGLGENIVQGAVNPDEIVVFKTALADPKKRPILRRVLGAKEKTMVFTSGGSRSVKNTDTPREAQRRFSLDDDEALQLARWAVTIENHTTARAGKAAPMDIEWAKDGESGKLYIVQARPETVHSQKGAAALVTYSLGEKGVVIARGRSVGDAIAAGKACVVRTAAELSQFVPGSILIAEMTDPDWVPIMRSAAGIITDHGGRTCHAAIVARELGIPAIVGSGSATTSVRSGEAVTMSCAGGDEGLLYRGALPFKKESTALTEIPATKTRILMNLADPASAFQWWRYPTDGIGLARIEFIITDEVRVHPMALVRFDEVKDAGERQKIEEICRGHPDKPRFFVETLGRGIGMLAASQHPRPVIVRMSDFKTNEYAGLVGGRQFEPVEQNPMIGFRGASRYYSDLYREGFALECAAIRHAREVIGVDNIIVMIPFCRTLTEADRVLEVMAANGLRRGEGGLKVYVMCEVPSNVVLATEFAERFDGFSIGSNDLTQLTLGVDRDSEVLASLFDERDPAVVKLIRSVITDAHAAGRTVGICGQAPSDHPGFAELLVDMGIDSISLNPDSVIAVKRRVAVAEGRKQSGSARQLNGSAADVIS